MPKGVLRVIGDGHSIFPEGTVPLIVVNQLELYCRDDNGDVLAKPTPEFLTKLNGLVIEIVDEALNNAVDNGRDELGEEDLPSFS
jgi:hypothetical protein